MDCKRARDILINHIDTTVSVSEGQEAGRHIAICQACQTGIVSLATAIKELERTCAMVQEALPIYVEEELSTKPVQFSYPHVWQHLRTCAFCAYIHAELSELLRFEREKQWIEPEVYPACTLSFLVSAEPASHPLAWTIENLREVQGYLSTVITFSKAYIMNSLNPQTPAWARSGDRFISSPTCFPLMDSLLEDSSWLVSMELLCEQGSLPGAERWHLQVMLTGSVSPTGIQVSMDDSGEERTIVVNERGEALFRNVSLAWLKKESKDTTDTGLKIKIRWINV